MPGDRIPAFREPKIARRQSRSRKLLFLLFLFFITILVILFFHSSLSKITEIEITGNIYTTEEAILDAAGVQLHDSFFLVFPDRAAGRIREFPEIEDARVTLSFPGKVSITVREYPAVAREYGAAGSVRIVLANGVTIPDDGRVGPLNAPVLAGWEEHAELRLKLCRTLGELPLALLSDVSEIRPLPSASYPDKIRMYTRSGFEVITSVSYLPVKLPLLDNIIADMKEKGHESGEILLLEGNSARPFDAVSDKADGDARDSEQEQSDSR